MTPLLFWLLLTPVITLGAIFVLSIILGFATVFSERLADKLLVENILSKLPWFPRWLRLIVLGIAGMVIVPYLWLWKAFTSDSERMERGQSGRLQMGDLELDEKETAALL
jgi:hypothetical protein